MLKLQQLQIDVLRSIIERDTRKLAIQQAIINDLDNQILRNQIGYELLYNLPHIVLLAGAWQVAHKQVAPDAVSENIRQVNLQQENLRLMSASLEQSYAKAQALAAELVTRIELHQVELAALIDTPVASEAKVVRPKHGCYIS